MMKLSKITLDNEAIKLLQSESLPTSDLEGPNQIQLYGARQHGKLIAIAGLEVFDQIGLLRSIVVDKSIRRSGTGTTLLDQIESLADAHGIEQLYLLTTSIPAESFFKKLGYKTIDRSNAPQDIASTTQFSTLCPSSAVLMSKKIAG